jgi:hypothetical protein
VDDIHARFPAIAILDALAVFDPRNLSPANDLVGYSDEQIRTLTDHFGQRTLKQPGFVTQQ